MKNAPNFQTLIPPPTLSREDLLAALTSVSWEEAVAAADALSDCRAGATCHEWFCLECSYQKVVQLSDSFYSQSRDGALYVLRLRPPQQPIFNGSYFADDVDAVRSSILDYLYRLSDYFSGFWALGFLRLFRSEADDDFRLLVEACVLVNVRLHLDEVGFEESSPLPPSWLEANTQIKAGIGSELVGSPETLAKILRPFAAWSATAPASGRADRNRAAESPNPAAMQPSGQDRAAAPPPDHPSPYSSPDVVSVLASNSKPYSESRSEIAARGTSIIRTQFDGPERLSKPHSGHDRSRHQRHPQPPHEAVPQAAGHEPGGSGRSRRA